MYAVFFYVDMRVLLEYRVDIWLCISSHLDVQAVKQIVTHSIYEIASLKLKDVISLSVSICQ